MTRPLVFLETSTELNLDEPDVTISAGPYPHVYLGVGVPVSLHVYDRTAHTRQDRLGAIANYLRTVAARIDEVALAELDQAISDTAPFRRHLHAIADDQATAYGPEPF